MAPSRRLTRSRSRVLSSRTGFAGSRSRSAPTTAPVDARVRAVGQHADRGRRERVHAFRLRRPRRTRHRRRAAARPRDLRRADRRAPDRGPRREPPVGVGAALLGVGTVVRRRHLARVRESGGARDRVLARREPVPARAVRRCQPARRRRRRPAELVRLRLRPGARASSIATRSAQCPSPNANRRIP